MQCNVDPIIHCITPGDTCSENDVSQSTIPPRFFCVGLLLVVRPPCCLPVCLHPFVMPLISMFLPDVLCGHVFVLQWSCRTLQSPWPVLVTTHRVSSRVYAAYHSRTFSSRVIAPPHWWPPVKQAQVPANQSHYQHTTVSRTTQEKMASRSESGKSTKRLRPIKASQSRVGSECGPAVGSFSSSFSPPSAISPQSDLSAQSAGVSSTTSSSSALRTAFTPSVPAEAGSVTARGGLPPLPDLRRLERVGSESVPSAADMHSFGPLQVHGGPSLPWHSPSAAFFPQQQAIFPPTIMPHHHHPLPPVFPVGLSLHHHQLSPDAFYALLPMIQQQQQQQQQARWQSAIEGSQTLVSPWSGAPPSSVYAGATSVAFQHRIVLPSPLSSHTTTPPTAPLPKLSSAVSDTSKYPPKEVGSSSSRSGGAFTTPRPSPPPPGPRRKKPSVDPEQLERGRWTEQEHTLFVEAVAMYGGNDWASISKHVGTRTRIQCASHAQKFFRKLRLQGASVEGQDRKKERKMSRKKRFWSESTSGSGSTTAPDGSGPVAKSQMRESTVSEDHVHTSASAPLHPPPQPSHPNVSLPFS